MKKVLVIQTTLNENGNTNKIARYAYEQLMKEKELQVEFLDLKESEIELCNGNKLEDYTKQTQDLYKYIQDFDAYILASPVYNHAISGVCKNFLDIHLEAMSNKYLGLIENAGGIHSQRKPYFKLKESVEYFKVKLLEFCPCSNTKSFKGDELIDDLVKSEFEKQKEELLKLLKVHTLENPIEDN